MGDDHARSDVDDRERAAVDRTAEDRDRTAEDRDQRADAHDRASEAVMRAPTLGTSVPRPARKSPAKPTQERLRTAGAVRDRQGGAADRTQAADDRAAAQTDRVLSAHERAASAIDELTGVHRRNAGIVELEREIARAKRTKQPFTLAFIDVDGLKGTNDSLGHAAGDQLLRETAALIRSHLRSYDLIIRFGGDEFVCGLLDLNRAEAAKRFSLVNADLAGTKQASVSVGLAELKADDAVEDLIARADVAMYKERQQGSAGA